ncbi:MAG: glycosyltransferase family 9 protein [Nitrospiraceae bacterium]
MDQLFPLEQDYLAQLLAGSESCAPTLRAWLDKTDLAVGWMKDSEGGLAATLAGLGAGKVILRSPMDSDHASFHQVDRYCETVSTVAGGRLDEKRLRLPDALLHVAAESVVGAGVGNGQAIVVLHPGSGSPHKCCGHGLFVKLIEQVRAWGALPVLLAGPADMERVRAIQDSFADPPVALEGFELIAVAGLLAQAALYIGHDSGITHLAACLHVPTIALFGPTDPQRWAPRGRHVEVVSGAPCVCRDWHSVQACTEKPCLKVPAEPVLAACTARLQDWAKSRIEARGAVPLPCHV